MSNTMTPYEKAGRVVRLLAWLSLILTVLMAVAVIAAMLAEGTVELGVLLLFAFFAGLAFFQLYLGKAIKEHEDWARTVGIVFAVIWLFGFPIGTIAGAYVLWCLIKGWTVQPA